jgi:DNA-binding response OmpR family regulator
VKSVVRRATRAQMGEGPLVLGEISLDQVTRRAFVAGEPLDFTATEFDLLAHLMSNPGRVYSREQLLAEVWGYAAVVGTRTVDVHVAQVRSKLGDHSPIRTVRGVGYSAELSTDLSS